MPRYSQSTKDEACRAVAAGSSYEEVACGIGCEPSTVRYWHDDEWRERQLEMGRKQRQEKRGYLADQVPEFPSGYRCEYVADAFQGRQRHHREMYAPHVDAKGYLSISVVRDGKRERVKEHRYVVEQALGRRLRKDEIVHHLDGNKLNNSIDNLGVLSPSRHSTLHSRDTKRKIASLEARIKQLEAALAEKNEQIGFEPEPPKPIRFVKDKRLDIVFADSLP